MPTTVTWATVQDRIRKRVLEEGGADFWADYTEVMVAYDEGVQRQHEVVLEAAEAIGKIRDVSVPYLEHFYSVEAGTLSVGEHEEALPADCYKYVDLYIAVASPVVRAIRKPAEMDTHIRRYKDFQPDYGEAFYVILGRADATGRVRVYTRGEAGWLNNASMAFEHHYYREPTLLARQSPTLTDCDVPDPYNEGPVIYAAAKLLAKQRTDPSPLFAEAAAIFRSVLPMPPAAPKG